MALTGYVFDCSIYCADCAGELGIDQCAESAPIFDNTDETDRPSHCANCGAYVQEQLTEEGICYVIEAIRREARSGWRSPVVSEWADVLSWYGLKGIRRCWLEFHTQLPVKRSA